MAFGECDGVGVIEVKVVGNLIPLTLLPEVAISRVFLVVSVAMAWPPEKAALAIVFQE